jgi:hypothetical protein
MVTTMVLATTGTSGGKSKKAPIKVKQDMIDFIKTQGMTKALKRAGSISAKGTKGEAEFLEGVRRMYGANRLSAATKAATPKKGSYQAGAGMAKKGTYTTGSGVSKPAAKTVTKPASKGMSGSTKAKIAGGAILAGGLLAAKATPAGRAASAAVGLGKGIAGAMGRKTATKALATSGKVAAKAKRPVSQAQYDAMKKVASAPKKFTKTKAAASGAGAVSMVPKPKKK